MPPPSHGLYLPLSAQFPEGPVRCVLSNPRTHSGQWLWPWPCRALGDRPSQADTVRAAKHQQALILDTSTTPFCQ